jgi:hypothetical protein
MLLVGLPAQSRLAQTDLAREVPPPLSLRLFAYSMTSSPCDVHVLLYINMLVEKGRPCVSMNDIMPVRQALRETLAESERPRPYSYKM